MTKKYSEIHHINPDQTNPFGNLTIATIFRYMQSAALNYNQDSPELKNADSNKEFHWLIYYSNIQIKNFISFNEKIKITTWIDDYKKALARRMYTIENVKTGQEIATGFTDWIYFNKSIMRPASVNPIVSKILFNNRPPKKEIKRIKMKPFEITNNARKTIQHVNLRHLDINHHVNNTVYIEYFLDHFSLVHEKLKINIKDYLSNNLYWTPTNYQIQYNLSAVLGEELQIYSQIDEISEDQIKWAYQIIKPASQKPITIAKVTYKLRNEKTKSFKKIPDEYVSKINKINFH